MDAINVQSWQKPLAYFVLLPVHLPIPTLGSLKKPPRQRERQRR